MPSRGMALRTGRARSLPYARLRVAAQPSLVATVLRDYVFGGPPAPVLIPYSWLAPPAKFRPEPLVNVATINQAGGGPSATSVNTASRASYGQRQPTPIELATDCLPDLANLAAWLTTYRSTPRMRHAALLLVDLNARAADECVRILRVREGDRVAITGAPATWPAGSSSFVVEGIAHTSARGERKVGWITSAIAGAVAGVPGPWFRWGSSAYGGTDVIPF